MLQFRGDGDGARGGVDPAVVLELVTTGVAVTVADGVGNGKCGGGGGMLVVPPCAGAVNGTGACADAPDAPNAKASTNPSTTAFAFPIIRT